MWLLLLLLHGDGCQTHILVAARRTCIKDNEVC